MAEFASRVMGLITGPGYRPMTLKAMSRGSRSEPADYAGFSSIGQEPDPRGKTARRARQDARAFPIAPG